MKRAIYYPFLLHARAALDVAADLRVDGPVISPELPQGACRWPHRVPDLGPFALVDAAAWHCGRATGRTMVEPAHGPALALTLPPRSFTVVEARIAATP